MSCRTNNYVNSWTPEEDQLLRTAVAVHKPQAWTNVATMVEGRNASQCKQRYENALAPGLKKGYWSKEEDSLLIKAVEELGKNFGAVSKRIPGRSVKQIRERYCRQLDPSIKQGKFSEEEDKLLLSQYHAHGGCWSKIAKLMQGRTSSQCKNRCNTLLGKRRNRITKPRGMRKRSRSSTSTTKAMNTTVSKKANAAEEEGRRSSMHCAVLELLDDIDSAAGLAIDAPLEAVEPLDGIAGISDADLDAYCFNCNAGRNAEVLLQLETPTKVETPIGKTKRPSLGVEMLLSQPPSSLVIDSRMSRSSLRMSRASLMDALALDDLADRLSSFSFAQAPSIDLGLQLPFSFSGLLVCS